MVWSPRVTVAAVIERDDRFLMVEENIDGRRVLNQPAGHLEPEESLQQAVIREVMEETAHPFVPTGLVGIYRWHKPGTDLTYLRFCFCGEAQEAVPGRELDSDILGTVWLTLEELSEQESRLRSPMVLQVIRDYLTMEILPLEALHEFS